MTESSEALTKPLAEVLRSSVNRDGGWGYFPGKASRLEPTCWAALALLDRDVATEDRAHAKAALTRIAAWQRSDGLLSDVLAAQPNVAFNGLAAIVLQRALSTKHANLDGLGQLAEKLLAAITQSAGVRQRQSREVLQNSQLVGWPWVDGTFSWVEPTSWCLFALKKLSTPSRHAKAVARIEEAERVLADRCCLSGGWNFGNSNVLGKELLPYVSNTCISLIALQDRQALPEVVRSVAWLAGNWQRERSALALSLALIAMTVYRRTVADLDRAIWAYAAETGPPANLCSSALLLYALTGPRHGYAALEL